MTSEEIVNTNDHELLMLYHEENEDAKNILYYKYKFVIDIMINKYKKYMLSLGIDYQEIYSECTVGFSDGLKCYQDDKSTSLATFITLCIERRLCNVIKKYNREKRKGMQETFSLDYIYEGNDVSLLNYIKDEYDPLTSITEQEGYNELLLLIKNELTAKEYEVFVLLIKGLNYLEIARILDNTPKQIDNTIQRVKNKIKKIMASKKM